jgi:hypothetical protein
MRFADVLDREYAARRITWAEFAVARGYRDLLLASITAGSLRSHPSTVRGHGAGMAGSVMRPASSSLPTAINAAAERQKELIGLAGRDDERIVRSALIGNPHLDGGQRAQFRAALNRLAAAVVGAEARARMVA